MQLAIVWPQENSISLYEIPTQPARFSVSFNVLVFMSTVYVSMLCC